MTVCDGNDMCVSCQNGGSLECVSGQFLPLNSSVKSVMMHMLRVLEERMWIALHVCWIL